ncbi:hypothetical protein [Oryzifoliimicrobium ureilyticus]|uniref:hypothetical protein n=1 Tax=Oryzifoliimicrobium ureilyticus TaxID=3113724 RepID=UPI003076691A
MKIGLAVFLFVLSAFSAVAEDSDGLGLKLGGEQPVKPGSVATMSELLAGGYQIKAAIPNGSKFVIFLQKDRSAYACEMQSLTASRCGTIN